MTVPTRFTPKSVFRLLAALLLCLLPSLANSQSETEILETARTGLLDSARALTASRLARYPHDPFATFMAAKLERDADTAFRLFQKLLPGSHALPQREESYFRMAQYYYAKGNYGMAIANFRKLLDRYPEGQFREQATYWMGLSCLFYGREENRGYLDSAEIHYRRLLKGAGPDDYYRPLAYEGLAKIEQARNGKNASKLLDSALAEAPKEQRPHLLWFGWILNREQGSKSSHLETLASEYPASLEASYFRKHQEQVLSVLPKPLLQRMKSPPVAGAGAGVVPGAGAVPASLGGMMNRNPDELKGPHVSLQLGAYSSRENAERFVKELEEKGFQARIDVSQREPRTLFVVKLGAFQSRDAALLFAEEKLKPSGLVSFIPVSEPGR